MPGSAEAARAPIDLHGLGPDVALLTAIDQALEVPEDDLPSRVALIRRYLRYLLDGLPDTRRNDRFQVIAGMIARDVSEE